jgi:hypothetical protein
LELIENRSAGHPSTAMREYNFGWMREEHGLESHRKGSWRAPFAITRTGSVTGYTGL